MPRVVLDVNVLVSARITPAGEAQAMLNQARISFDLLVSDFVLQKVEQVLGYPHIQARYSHLNQAVIREYGVTLRALSIPVIEKTVVTASSDPEDNRVLAVAVDGQADYLVTRNLAHFPSTYGRIKIVSPADFRKLLKEAESPSAPSALTPEPAPGESSSSDPSSN